MSATNPHVASPPQFVPIRPPVKCPVCEGRGAMPGEFYLDTREAEAPGTAPPLTTVQPTQCRSCLGRGIV